MALVRIASKNEQGERALGSGGSIVAGLNLKGIEGSGLPPSRSETERN